MLGLRHTPRMEELSASTLDKSYAVARMEFLPDALARRLKARLLELVESQRVVGSILEIPLDASSTCLAASAWVFVNAATYRRLQEIALPELDEWLVESVLRNDGGVLGRDEVAFANARGDLHVLNLYFRADDTELDEQSRTTAVHQMMSCMFPQITGYHLRSLTARTRYRAQATSSLQAGCRLLRPEEVPPAGTADLLPFPVLVHAEREWVEFNTWIASAFVWSRPRFGLSAAEQRTLALAVYGYSDDEIAAACAVSASTVKKRWESIFARVVRTEPAVLAAESGNTPAPGRRGREKRGRILSYIARHPEELTPYAAA